MDHLVTRFTVQPADREKDPRRGKAQECVQAEVQQGVKHEGRGRSGEIRSDKEGGVSGL